MSLVSNNSSLTKFFIIKALSARWFSEVGFFLKIKRFKNEASADLNLLNDMKSLVINFHLMQLLKFSDLEIEKLF